jgi:hypothetical protein
MKSDQRMPHYVGGGDLWGDPEDYKDLKIFPDDHPFPTWAKITIAIAYVGGLIISGFTIWSYF